MPSARLDRREFLAAVGKCAGAAYLGCSLGALPPRAFGEATPKLTREVDHYVQLPGKKIQCFVCPLYCILQNGETCFCRTRTNVGGKLFTRAYNNPCILRVDPIEKLPLNHFRPGSRTLTLGTGGCNVRCLYCQNWQQSQKKPDELKTFDLTARDAVAAARKKKVDTIAFSYTEPVAFLEYAKDIAIQAKKARLNVVVATAAFVEPDPLVEFAQHVDAFVVTLKGFSEEFYHRALGIELAPVLTAIQTLKDRTDCWLELSNLIVPTYNDDLDEIRSMVRWVHDNLGDDVPMHFARFVPTYRLANLPRTPVQTLEAACEIGRQAGLRYVYTSNIAPHEGCNTVCAHCGATVIERLGFKILSNDLKRSVCPKCHERLPGVWY
jgi:pyruvate formate lyase activating enzyme